MTMTIKISEKDIYDSNINIFGNWINNEQEVFTDPFKYCIIENFLEDNYYEKLKKIYPEKPNNHFWKYENPLEVKYALDDMNIINNDIKNIFYALSHDILITKFKKIFNIEKLEHDKFLHGGGLHIMPKNGRLNMHLDYEKHPILNKQRMLNIIYFVNEYWEESWKGDLQFWNKDMEKCVKKIFPKKNRAVIFETIENSWHGVPDKINCPDDEYRKTIAYYYLCPLSNSSNKNKLGANSNGFREKAYYIKRPNDIYDEKIEKLYDIRPYRRITSKDMKEIWPDWNINI